MKAITIRQPWAQLIALEEKKIETRSWMTRYRGPVAIHAGLMKAQPDVLTRDGRRLADELIKDIPKPLPHGAILAVANLVDVVPLSKEYVEQLTLQERTFGDYRPGRFAWVLDDIRPLSRPIEWRGQQGLWTIYDDARIWEEVRHG